MVGPVGFEPTTSGLRTVWSLRSPAPQVHRTLFCALVSCWRKSCSRTKLPRDYQLTSSRRRPQPTRRNEYSLIIIFHCRLNLIREFRLYSGRIATDPSCLYSLSVFSTVLRLLYNLASSLRANCPKRKYCMSEVTFATRLLVLALSKSTMHAFAVRVH